MKAKLRFTLLGFIFNLCLSPFLSGQFINPSESDLFLSFVKQKALHYTISNLHDTLLSEDGEFYIQIEKESFPPQFKNIYLRVTFFNQAHALSAIVGLSQQLDQPVRILSYISIEAYSKTNEKTEIKPLKTIKVVQRCIHCLPDIQMLFTSKTEKQTIWKEAKKREIGFSFIQAGKQITTDGLSLATAPLAPQMQSIQNTKEHIVLDSLQKKERDIAKSKQQNETVIERLIVQLEQEKDQNEEQKKLLEYELRVKNRIQLEVEQKKIHFEIQKQLELQRKKEALILEMHWEAQKKYLSQQGRYTEMTQMFHSMLKKKVCNLSFSPRSKVDKCFILDFQYPFSTYFSIEIDEMGSFLFCSEPNDAFTEKRTIFHPDTEYLSAIGFTVEDWSFQKQNTSNENLSFDKLTKHSKVRYFCFHRDQEYAWGEITDAKPIKLDLQPASKKDLFNWLETKE